MSSALGPWGGSRVNAGGDACQDAEYRQHAAVRTLKPCANSMKRQTRNVQAILLGTGKSKEAAYGMGQEHVTQGCQFQGGSRVEGRLSGQAQIVRLLPHGCCLFLACRCHVWVNLRRMA